MIWVSRYDWEAVKFDLRIEIKKPQSGDMS